MKPARPKRGQPRKGRPAALAASPSDAKRQRGGRRGATQGVFHFKLMVVFTPWLVVLSSNQRAVTVLVCV